MKTGHPEIVSVDTRDYRVQVFNTATGEWDTVYTYGFNREVGNDGALREAVFQNITEADDFLNWMRDHNAMSMYRMTRQVILTEVVYA